MSMSVICDNCAAPLGRRFIQVSVPRVQSEGFDTFEFCGKVCMALWGVPDHLVDQIPDPSMPTRPDPGISERRGGPFPWLSPNVVIVIGLIITLIGIILVVIGS